MNDLERKCHNFILQCYFGDMENPIDAAIDRAYVDMASHTLKGFAEHQYQEKWELRFEASSKIKKALDLLDAESDYTSWHCELCGKLQKVYTEKRLSYLVGNNTSVVKVKDCREIKFLHLGTNVILKFRNVGKPLFKWNCCLEISIQNVLGSNFRRRFHIIRTFSANDGFKSKYAHNSVYSLDVNSMRKFVDLLSVYGNTHLSVSENSVAFFVVLLHIFRYLQI